VIGTDQVGGRTAVLVATGDGALALHRLQLEGRKELDAAAFLRGQPTIIGARLG
jgi:methionyl-tRNA formyltransferase